MLGSTYSSDLGCDNSSANPQLPFESVTNSVLSNYYTLSDFGIL